MNTAGIYRRMPLTAAVLALALVVAACGSDEDDPEPSEDDTTTTTVMSDDGMDDTTTTVMSDDGMDDTTTTVMSDDGMDDTTTTVMSDDGMDDTTTTVMSDDGMDDTTTTMPSDDGMDDTTTTMPSDDAPSFSEEEQAAADVWVLVFDPSVEFEDKASHIEDAAELEELHAAFVELAQAFNPSVVVTDVTIEDTTASLTFDVLVGDTVMGSGNPGILSMVDGTWVVPRVAFITFLEGAGVPMPDDSDDG